MNSIIQAIRAWFKQPKQRPAEEYWFTPEGERRLSMKWLNAQLKKADEDSSRAVGVDLARGPDKTVIHCNHEDFYPKPCPRCISMAKQAIPFPFDSTEPKHKTRIRDGLPLMRSSDSCKHGDYYPLYCPMCMAIAKQVLPEYSKKENEKALHDAMLTGIGVMKDGKHVPIPDFLQGVPHE